MGEFSLSLSATRQRLVDVLPPRLLPVSQEGARNTIQACRSIRSHSHFDKLNANDFLHNQCRINKAIQPKGERYVEPAFKDITFGNPSAQCSPRDTRATVTPDGGAISVLFDKMQAQAGAVKRSSSQVYCDLTLRLVSPVDTTTEVQLNIGGAINKTDRATVSSTIFIRNLAHRLTFNGPDAAGTARYVTTLPKGARKLSVSIAATARAKYPESAIISIDSLDVTFNKRE